VDGIGGGCLSELEAVMMVGSALRHFDVLVLAFLGL
jgi:hypothetical protein